MAKLARPSLRRHVQSLLGPVSLRYLGSMRTSVRVGRTASHLCGGRMPAPSPNHILQSARSLSTAVVTGKIDWIVHHNKANGYTVLSIVPDPSNQTDTTGEDAKKIMVTCWSAVVQRHQHVEIRGSWHDHKKYGRQLVAEEGGFKVMKNTEGSLSQYLSSSLPGVGNKTAQAIVEKYGLDALEILKTDTEAKLRQVSGIGKAKARKIAAGIDKLNEHSKEEDAKRELFQFLISHGLRRSKVERVVRSLSEGRLKEMHSDKVKQLPSIGGPSSMLSPSSSPSSLSTSIGFVQEDPYKLMDIASLTFLEADAFALRVGVDAESPIRLDAAISYILHRQVTHNSMCSVLEQDLVHRVQQMGLGFAQAEVFAALRRSYESNNLVCRMPEGEVEKAKALVFPKTLDDMEEEIAERLRLLLLGKPQWLNTYFKQDLDTFSLTLTESQKAAVLRVVSSKVSILTGGPGVGKTTVIRAVTSLLMRNGQRVALLAPTGIAAERLGRLTGVESATIHGALFADKSRMLDAADMVVVDETSMLDVALLSFLLSRLNERQCILFVGDPNQLQPIGPGRPLWDMVESDCVPTMRLSAVFRQRAQSKIVKLAHQIATGQQLALEDNDEDGDFFFVPQEADHCFDQTIVDIVNRRIPNKYGFDPKKDIMVLCPSKRGHVGGTADLNTKLQNSLNPRVKGKRHVEAVHVNGRCYAVDDKVMVTRNIHNGRRNGEVGVIRSFGRDADGHIDTVVVSFNSWGELQSGARPSRSGIGSVSVGGSGSVSVGGSGSVSAAAQVGLSSVESEESGYVEGISVESEESGYVEGTDAAPPTAGVAQFDQAMDLAEFEVGDLDNLLTLAYAVTVHKSQGAEYPCVVVPFPATLTPFFLSANLVYTAVTRARQLVVVVGDPKCFRTAASQWKLGARNSLLVDRIRRRLGRT